AEKECYKTPSRPLTYDYNLNRAARFHCANLISCGGHLQHDSPCKLVNNLNNIYLPNGSCDGSASCACEGGKCGCSSGCTSWNARISMFGTSPSGENAAYGYSDPVQTFYQWFWEPESDSSCGFRSTNGHRVNILNNSHSAVGIGNYNSYWTQDFSASSGYSRKLYSGTHYPKSGTNIEFRANWADSSGPSVSQVIIDGIPFDMNLERGSTANGTYLYKANLPNSCHKYYFFFKTAGGTAETFPDEGAYGINCSEDYFPTRESVDAGHSDSVSGDIKDSGNTVDIVIPDTGRTDSGRSDTAQNTQDSEYKRDAYPDYVNEGENGCSCNFID
ncbi:MAG: CAP domain-containing protein, partial [Deltaproteobacteria bacterium]|nr:CAP domain-containing protein [Deltaproteobacteria bacterium]